MAFAWRSKLDRLVVGVGVGTDLHGDEGAVLVVLLKLEDEFVLRLHLSHLHLYLFLHLVHDLGELN
jgi:hypothetical protein